MSKSALGVPGHDGRDDVNLSEEQAAAVVDALIGMVAKACGYGGELNTMMSTTYEQAIEALVMIGQAEWIDEAQGSARWKP